MHIIPLFCNTAEATPPGDNYFFYLVAAAVLAFALICHLLVKYHGSATSWLRRKAKASEIFFIVGAISVILGLGVEAFRCIFPEKMTSAAALVLPAGGILLTFMGLLFSIYSIKGIFERLRDLSDTIDRSIRMIEESKSSKMVIIMLCEYPGWGCLSEKRKFVEFLNSFLKLLVANRENNHEHRIILVSPNEQGMKNHIATYARDYGRSHDELATAIADNERILKELTLFDNRFKHHICQPSSPRYQMLLICDYGDEKDGFRITPRNGIVWLVPRSSEAIVEYGSTVPVELGNRPQGSVNSVLAWEIDDLKTLAGLLDDVFFFVDNSRTISNSQFLNIV